MNAGREARLQAIPQLDPKVDLRSLPLDAREGFVLSRIDGTCNVQTLGALVGMSDDAIVEMMEKLVKLGAVTAEGWTAPTPDPDKDELPAEQRDRIQKLHDALPMLTHYDLLKLPRTAPAEAIKPAYYAFSKEYHPDRFYRKQLGPHKVMIEQIFKAGKHAYEVLADAGARTSYDKTLPHPLPTEVPQNPTLDAAEAKRAALEAHRQKILAERKATQKKPLTEQIERAKAHALEAETLFHKGDMVGAVAKLALALAFDPANEAYVRRHAELQPVANERRAQELANKAAAEQKTGNYAGAAALYRQAFDALPGNGVFAHRSAELYLAQGNDMAAARQLAEAAVDRAPKNPEYRFTLAQILDKMGDMTKAREALNAALGLGLDTPEAKKMSKRLK